MSIQQEHRQDIRIRLKAFDHRTLDLSTREIVSTAKRTGAQVRGPIPLPTRIERFTVNRSPHVDKKSREQFEIRTHKRVLDIVDSTPQTVDALMRLDLSAGVDVQIQLREARERKSSERISTKLGGSKKESLGATINGARSDRAAQDLDSDREQPSRGVRAIPFLALIQEVDSMISGSQADESRFIKDIQEFLATHGSGYFFRQQPTAAEINWSRIVAERLATYLSSPLAEMRSISGRILDWLAGFEPELGNASAAEPEWRVGKFLGILGSQFVYTPNVTRAPNKGVSISAEISTVIFDVFAPNRSVFLSGLCPGQHVFVSAQNQGQLDEEIVILDQFVEDPRRTLRGEHEFREGASGYYQLALAIDGICLDERLLVIDGELWELRDAA